MDIQKLSSMRSRGFSALVQVTPDVVGTGVTPPTPTC
jgi:hypothetical protein